MKSRKHTAVTFDNVGMPYMYMRNGIDGLRIE